MKTFLTLSAILVLIFAWSLPSVGKPVDLDDVMRLGENYLEAEWQFRTGGISQSEYSGAARAKRSISGVRELRDNGRLLAYVLDLDPQGCIIVSTDTDINPVIAYSDTGRFSMADDPENIFLHLVRWDMQNRLNARPVTSKSLITENNYLWSEYLAKEGRFTTLAASSDSWGPWLKTQWSQGIPHRQSGRVYPDYDYGDYNRYCPVGHDIEWRSVTGCGPTALGQLINYWKYPSSMSFGAGDSYTSRKSYVSGKLHNLVVNIDEDHDRDAHDFPSFNELNSMLSSIRYYDGDLYVWHEDLWNYTSPIDDDPDLSAAAKQETKDDIAALLFACGIVMEAKYSPGREGTTNSYSYSPGIVTNYSILTNRFGYSSASMADVSWLPFYATLEQNMKDEQPALLFIDSQIGLPGHILVTDGYRDEWQGGSQGYYHLNFGWGPTANPDSVSDSWYHLPEGIPNGYSVVKVSVLDVYPSDQWEPPQQNTPPVADNPNISPPVPKTGDNVVASYSYSDADGDLENGSEIRWYKDDVVQSAHNDSSTVPSSSTSKGESWYFTVRPNDGISLGSTVTSSRVTIGNTAPTADANGPYAGEIGEIVTFNAAGSSDVDGDSSLIYTWNFGDGNGDTTQNTTTTYAYAAASIYTVTLTVSDGSDTSSPAQASAVITEPASSADIAVSKRVDNVTPNAGDAITYTVTATNNGPDDATDLEITDVLPPGLDYVSDSPSRGSYNEATGEWTIGTLADSVSVTLTITATVGVGEVAENIVNTASVTDVDQTDPNSGNNSASADVTVQYADLGINKSVDNPTPDVGGTVVYTVVVTNNGPATATSVEITDQLPSGLEYLSATATKGSWAYVSITNEVVFTIGSLSDGTSATLTISARVDTNTCSASITNTASVTGADQVDPDSANNSHSADITLQCADLEVSKSVDEPNPHAGDTIKYTVIVKNNGPGNAANVELTDQLPLGVVYKSVTATQGNYNSVTGIWTVGGLNNGVNEILTISATVDTNACSVAIINTASITATSQADPDSSNNSDSIELTVQCADLEVRKSVDNPTPDQGETIIYTIVVTNNGPDDATGVQLTDRLPPGVIYSLASPTRGGISYVSVANSQDGQSRVVWALGNLLNGASATVTITARIDAGVCAETLTNIASITAVDQGDPDSSNNSGSADVIVNCVDLAVSKSVNEDSPNEGDTIVYTVTVTNNGAEPATNVEVTDQLPPGITYVLDNGNGSYNSSTGVWTIGSLNSGASVALDIVVTVHPESCAEAIVNIASITAVDQADPDTSNNSASVSIAVECADLGISKTVDNDSPNEGDAVTYTITLTNNGPDTATHVQVTDILPSGVAYTTATGDYGSYSDDTGVWAVGNLSNGTSATLYIIAEVSEGIVNENNCGVPITNSASITAVDQSDPDASNNNASADIMLQCADLRVDKTVDNEAPDEGDTITYTVTVSNDGVSTATNVEITDILPTEVTYTSATATQGDFAHASAAASSDRYDKVVWTVGSLADGANATITIMASVNENTCGILIVNTASITAADQIDPDMGNNSDSVDVAVPCVGLEVSKTVDNPTPEERDIIIYTVTVTNSGSSPATNVQITDKMPSGVTYVSDDAGGGYNNIRGVWTLRSLDGHSSAVLNITAKVDKGVVNGDNADAAITNTASITAIDQADSDSSNDSDSADIIVQYVDLEVGMSVDNDTPNEGDTIAYTVTATNGGTGTATHVIIAVQLPPELTYISDDAAGGYDSIAGTWAVNSLSGGASAALEITAIVNTGVVNENTIGVPITSTATLTSVEQVDSDSSNNSDSADITVQCADLEIGVSVDDDSPNEGDTVTYTVTARNNGPDAATNVVIAGQLASGLTYLSDSSGQGSYNNGIWTLGALNSGANATLAVMTILDGQGLARTVMDYTASVASVDQADENDSNNSSSVSLTVLAIEADLAVEKEVDNDLPNAGDTIIYTIKVTNNGPDDASSVELVDQLPAGITYVSDDGDYNSGDGVWTVGNLAYETSAILIITAMVDPGTCADTITNTASIAAVDQADPESGNNSAAASITMQCADLEMSVSVDNPAPNEGDTITYTVTATNNGSHDATNVVVTDQLPSGVTYVSDSGGYDNNTGVWSIGSLSNGDSVILIITVTVDAGSSGSAITNSASVTSADQADPDVTNNVSSVSLASVRMQLISASYEIMESLLTLVFNDPIDPDQTDFDRIRIEIANDLIPGFSLSDCPSIETGTPYEDHGVMLYPITIDIQCDILSVLGLAIPAFVSALSDGINVVLESEAFTHPDGGHNSATRVGLSIAVDGLNLKTQGDLSGDGRVTALDASLILRYIVYGENVLPIYDTVAELVDWLETLGLDGDVSEIIEYLANTDNKPGVTAFDAVMALQFAAGLIDSFCESCASGAEMIRRNGRLMATEYNDGILEVSIDLDDADDVYSADMMVTYDPEILTLTHVSGAAATSGWLSEHRITSPGKLRISMAGAHQPDSDGSLVTLSFDAASPDAIKSLNLREFKLNGGRLRTEIHNLPRMFALLQNYPNPFNPETWIPYRLSEPANVAVTIYNMAGQVVRRLEFGNRMPGSYVDRTKAAYWDGKNQHGEKVSSGIYFYKLQAGREASVGKMTVVE